MTTSRKMLSFASLSVVLACGGSGSSDPTLTIVGDRDVARGGTAIVQFRWGETGDIRFALDRAVWEPLPPIRYSPPYDRLDVTLKVRSDAPLGIASVQTAVPSSGPVYFNIVDVIPPPTTEAWFSSNVPGHLDSGNGQLMLNLRDAATATQQWDIATTGPVAYQGPLPLEIMAGQQQANIPFAINGVGFAEVNALRAAGAVSVEYTVLATPIGSSIFNAFSGEVKRAGVTLGNLTLRFHRVASGMFNNAFNRVHVDFTVPELTLNLSQAQSTFPISFSSGGRSYSVFITTYASHRLTGTVTLTNPDEIWTFDISR